MVNWFKSSHPEQSGQATTRQRRELLGWVERDTETWAP